MDVSSALMSVHHRHRRIRRAKQFLRFMPRRAMFHRYPFIGRFAALARKEQHLWSIRRGPMRRAFYLGSVLALLPLLGVQLLVGLALAVIARANFMVLGGLQFITNPFTAVPIYGATFLLGRKFLHVLGFEVQGARPPEGWQQMSLTEILQHIGFGTAIGHGAICLVVGGIICGLVLGGTLDLVYHLGLKAAGQPPAPEQPHKRSKAG